VNTAVSERMMVDHLAWARDYRDRAARCQLSAKSVSSSDFGNCYRLLTQHYMLLAKLEEDFAHRQIASRKVAETMAAD
jgi:hypothetical protein